MTRIRRAWRVGVILLGLVLAPSLLPRAGQPGSPGRGFVLPNGLRVFLYEKHDLPLINIVVSVNAGSKDESDANNGIAHLLEHCLLFRGTATRSGGEVSRDVRRHGAYFNANTGQDLTLFEISLPPSEADFALRNQKEVLFDFALTQAELDEEKAVVLEEMNQTEDDPQRHGTDLAMRFLFDGHPYGKPVYGLADVVRAARVEELRDFHAKYYVPNNCALAIVGEFWSQEMEEKVRAIFGPLEKASLQPASIANARLLGKSITFQEEKDVKEAYLFIAYIGPDSNHPDQYAMDLLTEAFGRGCNPLLNIALRSRRDLVQNMNMAYIPGRFGGAVIVSLTLDPKNIVAATRETVTYLRKSGGENFSRDDFPEDEKYDVFDFLGSAKNQIRFAAEQAEESGLVLASSLARFMLQNKRENPGRFLDHIAGTSSGDLRKAATVYFGKGQCAVISIVPKRAESGKRG